MMKAAEFQEWARVHHKRPGRIVLSTEVPAEINQVILYGEFRVRVVRKLTRAEFMERLRENFKYSSAVGVVATVSESRVQLDETAQDVPELGPEFQYFYACEVI